MALVMIGSKIHIHDNNNEPAEGWKIYTYEAGTTNLKDTWIDEAETVANTNPVILDSRGEAIIRLSGSYKIKLTDKNDNEIWIVDNQTQYNQRDWSGLTATITELNATNTSTIAKTADYPITLTDRGKTILVDATAATPTTITLLNATAATNGYQITIKKTDKTTNLVNIDATTGQKVDGVDPFVLYDYNDFVKILSDGSNWHLIAGKIRGSVITKTTTPFAVALEDERNTYLIDASSGAFAVNLPAINTVARGYRVNVKKIDSSSNAVTISADGTEQIDGTASVIIYMQYDFISLINDGANWFVIGEYGSEADDALPPNYITGFSTERYVDLDHDIKITIGFGGDTDHTMDLRLTSAIVKRIDANWVAGTNNGGFPSALTLSADTWYHLFVIGKTDGTVDAGYDSAINASNLLVDATGYTGYRRVGSIRTDASSNILNYQQSSVNPSYFYWAVRPKDIDDTDPGTGVQNKTLSVPLGINAYAIIAVHLVHSTSLDGTTRMNIIRIGTTEDTIGTQIISRFDSAASINMEGYSQIHILTDTAAQMQYKLSASVGNTKVEAWTHGWIDNRGAG